LFFSPLPSRSTITSLLTIYRPCDGNDFFPFSKRQ
jgi:hypothetical protein